MIMLILSGALACFILGSFPTVFHVSKVSLGMLAGAFLVGALMLSRLLG